MKKIIAMLVVLMTTLFTVSALAYTPPPSPAPASWISDNSHVLSTEAHARLDAKLRQINQSSANEIAALILPSLDGENIADVGDITAKTWGVGKKGLDNGVLVVLAMKDRKSRISTGKGVEGDLPDLKANDILNAARPYLRRGDVEGALGFIFDSSASAIANHKAEVAAGRTGTTSSRPACDVSGGVGIGGDTWLLVFAAGSAIALVWYLAAQAKRRRLAEEAERLAAKQRSEARRRQIEEREAARKRDVERQRQQVLTKPTPVVTVPVPRPAPKPSVKPTVPRPEPRTPSVVPAASIAAAATLAAAEDQARKSRAEEDRRRKQREQDEEDRRRKQREDDDRRSSSYSSPSYSSWDSGSSGGSSGGFGGGDSGGGGSSSDW